MLDSRPDHARDSKFTAHVRPLTPAAVATAGYQLQRIRRLPPSANARLPERRPSLQKRAWRFDCRSVTRRLVGSLKLYSLFPDGGYFFHREQTLRLHVLNAIG